MVATTLPFMFKSAFAPARFFAYAQNDRVGTYLCVKILSVPQKVADGYRRGGACSSRSDLTLTVRGGRAMLAPTLPFVFKSVFAPARFFTAFRMTELVGF